MDFDSTYSIEPDEYSSIYHYDMGEITVTCMFMIGVLAVFLMSMIIATLILIFKPQLFRLHIYPDPLPQMTDCTCLNMCFPCSSCSCRVALNGCCPRMNLKSFNCIKTCCDRPGTEKINLVCCVV